MPTEKVFTGGFDLKHNQDDLTGEGNFVQTIGGPRFYDFSVGDFSQEFPAMPPFPDFPDFPQYDGDGLEPGMVTYDAQTGDFYYWDGTDWILIDPTGGGGTPGEFPFEDIFRYHHVSGSERLEVVDDSATWTAFQLPADALDLTDWELEDINEVLPDWFQFDEVAEVIEVVDPPVAPAGPKNILTFVAPTFSVTPGEVHIILPGLPTEDPGNDEVWLSDT